jgi:hypothetical protein
MLSREGGPLEFMQPPNILANRKEFLNIKGKAIPATSRGGP